MAHEVETMASVESTWHGLETRVNEDCFYDRNKFMIAAGMNWQVEKREAFTFVDGFEECPLTEKGYPTLVKARVPDCFAVVRSSDNKVLGNVGNRYHVLQNSDAFKWFDPFLEAKTAKLWTAGSLREGSRVWVLAKMETDPVAIVKDDVVEKYILLAHAHDGSLKIRAGFTPQRVVCANTLAMAIEHNASKLLQFKHCKNLHDNMEKVRDIMNVANSAFEATMEQYKFLASRQFKADELQKFVKVLFKINPEDDELHTRVDNKLERIIQLVLHGKGNDAPGVRGTWWAAYNGFNEFLNYEKSRNAENSRNNLWFGPDHTLNSDALHLAMQYADGKASDTQVASAV